MVRLASGEVGKADIVGTTPDYDLAVIQFHSSGHLPMSVAKIFAVIVLLVCVAGCGKTGRAEG
jgi:hypothetical protein